MGEYDAPRPIDDDHPLCMFGQGAYARAYTPGLRRWYKAQLIGLCLLSAAVSAATAWYVWSMMAVEVAP